MEPNRGQNHNPNHKLNRLFGSCRNAFCPTFPKSCLAPPLLKVEVGRKKCLCNTMTIIEQIIQCIFQNFANPLFEPIIIDKQIIRIFNKLIDKLDKHEINTKLLKEAKRNIESFPDDLFSTNILKSNVIRFLNVLIKNSRANRRKIKGLKTDIEDIENKYTKLQEDYTKLKKSKQSTNVILDTNSSKLMREATTIFVSIS